MLGIQRFFKNIKGSPLWKRAVAVLLVFGMLATLIPANLMIVRADDNQSNLANYTHSVTLSGVTDDGVTWQVIKSGVVYGMRLSFKEGSLQFVNDATTMSYQLPDGVNGNSHTGTIDIVVSDGESSFTVSGNTFTVDSNTNIVTFQFNDQDPYFQQLTETGNAQFYINFDVTFDSDADGKTLDFGNGVTRTVVVDSSHHARVSKSSNYNYNDHKIYYTITVSSDGISENVAVSDVVSGSALSINTDSVTINPSGAWAGTPTITSSGISGTIAEVGNNETVTITYSADVDFSQLDSTGKITASKTGNDVEITVPDDSDPTSDHTSHTENTINVSSIQKTSTGVTDNGDNTSTVSWRTVVNPECILSLAGETITDHTSAFNALDQTIQGDVTLKVYNASGSLVDTRTFSGTTGWNYTVPNTDGIYRYEFTYNTVVNTTGLITDDLAINTAEYDYGTSETTATVPIQGGFETSKSVVNIDYDNNKIDWLITVDVPKTGFSSLVVEDTFPTQGNVPATEAMVGVPTITGTVNSETYETVTTSSGVTFTFKKSDGSAGLDATANDRQITIALSTEISDAWLTFAKNNTWAAGHTNQVSVTANSVVKSTSATAYPAVADIKKTGSLAGTTADGLPYYKYEVVINPVSQDSVTIQDTLPTELEFYQTPSDFGTVYGGDQWYQGSQGSSRATVSGDTFTVPIHKNSSNEYYGYYRMVYYAKVKDANTLKDLGNAAIQSDGHSTTLTNTATYRTASATADVVYTVDDSLVLNKELTNFDALSASNHYATYEVTINSQGLTLNNGEPVKFTDVFENLSIDYSSITFTPAVVTEANVSGNTLTAYIPDETPVVLTYTAKVNGTGDVTFTNTASMKGFISISSKTKSFDSSSQGGGSSSIPSIRIFKQEKGNSLIPLSGAVFALYEEDGTPINNKDGNQATFTTGSDGMVTIRGTMTANGWALQEDTRYYVKEITAPTGYKLDTTKYYFTISSTGVADYPNYVYYDNDIMRINNTKTATGELTVTKTVAGAPAEFDPSTVSLTVTDASGKTYTKTLEEIAGGVSSTSVEYNYDSGTNTYSWTLKQLPVGEATVKETVSGSYPGYTLTQTYQVNAGASTAYSSTDYPTVTVSDTVAQQVAFTNTYTENADGKITITKTYAYSSAKGRTFSFGLFTSDGGSGYVRYGSQTKKVTFAESALRTNLATGSMTKTVSFTDLPYGTYYVFELDGDGNPITANGNTLEYTVDATGLSGQPVTLSASNKEEAAAFTNTEKTGYIQVSKQVVGEGIDALTPDQCADITIRIRDANGTTYEKTLAEIKTGVSDAKQIFTYSKDASGNLNYTWKMLDMPLGSYNVTETNVDSVTNYTLQTQTYTSNETIASTNYPTAGITTTVTKDANAIVALVNTYQEDTGKLLLKKIISGDTPSETQSFFFLVRIKDREGNWLTSQSVTFGSGSSAKTLTFDADGVAKVEVQGGKTVTIDGIPVGYRYLVEEYVEASTNYPYTAEDGSETDKHYQFRSVTNGTGAISATVNRTASVNNQYYELGKLSVRKNVEVDNQTAAIPLTDPFAIHITLQDASGNPVAGTYPITYTKTVPTASGVDTLTETTTITFNSSGIADIELCHNWEAVISDLEIGYTYEVTEDTYNYSAAVIAGDSETYGYKNNGIDGATGTVANGVTRESVVNNLYREKPMAFTIQKEVAYPAGVTLSEDLIPDDVNFKVHIQFVDEFGNADTTISGVHGSATFTAGEADVVLQNGQLAAITGIPENKNYIITEIQMQQANGSWVAIPNESADARGFVKTGTDGVGATGNENIYINGVQGNAGVTTGGTSEIVVKNTFYPSKIYVGKMATQPSTGNTLALGTGGALSGATLCIIDTATGAVATDASGASISWITDGTMHEVYSLVADGSHTYILRETKAPNGFTRFADVRFVVNADNSVTVQTQGAVGDYITQDTEVVSNDALTAEDGFYSIRVKKVGSDATSTILTGANLELLDSQGNVVTINSNTISTTTDGSAWIINGIKPGTYTLRETGDAPTGYYLAEDITFTLNSAGKILIGGEEVTDITNHIPTITMVDQRIRYIYVSKVQATGETEIAGATLQLLDSNGRPVSYVFDNSGNGNLAGNGATGAVTSFVSRDTGGEGIRLEIKPGTYTLRETVAPAGYSVTTDTKFNVTEDGSINYDGIPEYDRTPLSSGNNSAGVKRLLVRDDLTAISINKVDVTGDQPLAGAKLQILDATGNPLYFDAEGNVVNAGTAGALNYWTSSGSTPKQIKGLDVLTTYTLVEVTAPVGYKVAASTTFRLNKYGVIDTSASTTTVSNNILLVRDNAIEINFTKLGLYQESCVDAPSNPNETVNLRGVRFTATRIKDGDGNAVTGETPYQAVSNRNGVVYFRAIPAGIYQVQELSSVTDYVVDTSVYYAKVTTDDFEGLYKDEACTEAVVDNRLINDIYRGRIEFTKVCETDENKKLAGSLYGLYRKESNGDLTRITTELTAADGTIAFDGVRINTEYVVQELQSPKGYYVSKNPITVAFKLDANGDVVLDESKFDSGSGTVVMDAQGNLTWLEPEVVVNFVKQDENGENLAGALLTVVDEAGNTVVEPWTTTSKVKTVNGVLKVGTTYKLVELKAPSGYEVADDVVFTVDDATVANSENKVITVTMVDRVASSTPDIVTTSVTTVRSVKTGDNTPLLFVMWLGMISLFSALLMIDQHLFGKKR